MKQLLKIYTVLQIETDDCPAYVVNAFKSKKQALKYYPDSSKYEIKSINVNGVSK